MFMFCECIYVCILFPVLAAFYQFMNKWMLLLLMTIDKDKCQTPKDDNYHKISHTLRCINPARILGSGPYQLFPLPGSAYWWTLAQISQSMLS